MLYHGTSARFAEYILQSGIFPRGLNKSNWSKYPSRKDMVYLTKAYAFYFGLCSAVNNEHVVVFEIDERKLDSSKFYPDEDFVEATTRKRDQKIVESNHNFIKNNLEKFGYMWMQSLQSLGNCCYKGYVPKEAITRYCIYDRSRPLLNIAFADPSITIMNYMICGEKYRNMTGWMFGDRDLLPQVEEDKKLIEQIKEEDDFKKNIDKRIEYWTKESSNRKGISVYLTSAGINSATNI